MRRGLTPVRPAQQHRRAPASRRQRAARARHNPQFPAPEGHAVSWTTSSSRCSRVPHISKQHLRRLPLRPPPSRDPTRSGIKLIAIGASTGGTDAIADVLHRLQPPLLPIVIVQHIPRLLRLFAIRLNEECTLPVNEGEDGLVLEPSHVYIAPGDYHMAICRQGGELALHCFHGPKVHSVRPAVDVLFGLSSRYSARAHSVSCSPAWARTARTGLLRLRQAGAPTIGQDRETCVVYGMPRIAQERGALLYQLPLPQIGPAIQKIAGARY